MRDFTFEEAISKIEDYLSKNEDETAVMLVLEETLHENFGWVFFYNSKSYLETGDFREMLGGNAPLIFNKKTGEIIVTGTVYDASHYVEEYKSSLKNK